MPPRQRPRALAASLSSPPGVGCTNLGSCSCQWWLSSCSWPRSNGCPCRWGNHGLGSRLNSWLRSRNWGRSWPEARRRERPERNSNWLSCQP